MASLLRLRSFLWERAVPTVVPGGTEPSVLKTGVYWPGTKPGPAAAERALKEIMLVLGNMVCMLFM